MGWGTREDISPPWPSKNKKAENGKHEDWWWQKNPIYNDGTITDPYAETDESWDDDKLDVTIDQDINVFRDKTPKNHIITAKDKALNVGVKSNGITHGWKKEELIRTVKLLESNDLSETKKKDKDIHKEKWKRCVKKVKKNSPDVNPYAVCTDSIGYEGSIKKKHRRQEINEEYYDFEDGIPFPEPITVGGKVYKNTNELESDFEIGSITNFNGEIKIDGYPYKEWAESMGGLELGETTTASSSGQYSTPIFAAKTDSDWKPAKKPIWKGGKIVQKIKNSGVLHEINKVKYTKDGEYVKFKERCVDYNNKPFCSQGAIDKPLMLSKTTNENISEVAKKLGISEKEVRKVVINRLSR
jgi:hypothetical protein